VVGQYIRSCALAALLLIGVQFGSVAAAASTDRIEEVRAERAEREAQREAQIRTAAEQKLRLEVLRAVHQEELKAYLVEQKAVMETMVTARMEIYSYRIPKEGREQVEASVRAEIEREMLEQVESTLLERERGTVAVEFERFFTENQAEVDRYMEMKLAQAAAKMGAIDQKTLADLRSTIYKELQAKIRLGVNQGRTALKVKREAAVVAERYHRLAAAQVEALRVAMGGFNSEVTYQRLRSAHDLSEPLLLKLEIVASAYPDLTATVEELRSLLTEARKRIYTLRDQLDQQGLALAAEAQRLAAQGSVESAVEKLKTAARLSPDNHALVHRIVALEKEHGHDRSNIFVNGVQLQEKPRLIEGRNLVPLRAMAEALGAQVFWDPDDQVVTFTRGDSTVKLQIGSSKVQVNEQQITIDVPAQIFSGRTFVPLRAVSEMLQAEVGWDPATHAVTVVDPVPEVKQ
jgi:hypothetical protein